jgi:ribosomal protein L32
MAVPKKKKSKSRCGHKNSQISLESFNPAFDSEGDMHERHRATALPDGSFRYKGKIIIVAKQKKKVAEE